MYYIASGVITPVGGRPAHQMAIYRGEESTKLRNYKNSHTGQCTRTKDSTTVKVQNIFQGEIALHEAQTVNIEQLQHYTH